MTKTRFRVGDRVRTSGGDVGVIVDKSREWIAGHPMLGPGSTQTIYTVEMPGFNMTYTSDDLTVIGHDRSYEA